MLEIFNRVYLVLENEKNIEESRMYNFSWKSRDKYPNGINLIEENIVTYPSFKYYITNSNEDISIINFFDRIIREAENNKVYIKVDIWSLSEVIYCWTRILFKYPRKEPLLDYFFDYFDEYNFNLEYPDSISRASSDHCKLLANTILDEQINLFLIRHGNHIPEEIVKSGFIMNKK